MRVGEAGAEREHLLGGGIEAVNATHQGRGLFGVFAMNGLSNGEVAVILRIDCIEGALFTVGFKCGALEVDPRVEFVAVALELFPIRAFAADLVGEQRGIETQDARLELPGDAEALELRAGKPVSQRSDVVPRSDGRPCNNHDQRGDESAKCGEPVTEL